LFSGYTQTGDGTGVGKLRAEDRVTLGITLKSNICTISWHAFWNPFWKHGKKMNHFGVFFFLIFWGLLRIKQIVLMSVPGLQHFSGNPFLSLLNKASVECSNKLFVCCTSHSKESILFQVIYV
jgi:hypothetical protein